jgi:hypothetical protein
LTFKRPLFPGDFTEAGGAIAYYYPLFRGRAFLGAGIGIYRRWYDEAAGTVVSIVNTVNNVTTVVSAGQRRDTYVEPSAHVILPNLLGPNLDLRFDYRYEHNTSNATTTTDATTQPGCGACQASKELGADFENHVAGVHIVGRF